MVGLNYFDASATGYNKVPSQRNCGVQYSDRQATSIFSYFTDPSGNIIPDSDPDKVAKTQASLGSASTEMVAEIDGMSAGGNTPLAFAMAHTVDAMKSLQADGSNGTEDEPNALIFV